MNNLSSSGKLGFSMTEILVVLFLTSVLMGVMVLVFGRSQNTYRLTYLKNDLQKRSQLSVDTVKQDIQRSTSTLTAYDTYTGTANVLILKIPRLDANQNIIDDTYDYLIYRRQPTQLNQIERIQIVDATTTTRLINGKVSALTFAYQDDDGNPAVPISDAKRVTIDVTSQDSLQGSTYDSTYSTTATLRNK